MAEQTLATPAKTWATQYELIYILRPNVDSEAAEKVATRVQEVLGKEGAKITKVETWGKRKLAYPIAKHTRGIFVYVGYVAHSHVVAELERNLRLLDTVVRYQTVKVRGFIDLADVQVNADDVEFERIEVTDDDDEPTLHSVWAWRNPPLQSQLKTTPSLQVRRPRLQMQLAKRVPKPHRLPNPTWLQKAPPPKR